MPLIALFVLVDFSILNSIIYNENNNNNNNNFPDFVILSKSFKSFLIISLNKLPFS